jgi:hypothetical protein
MTPNLIDRLILRLAQPAAVVGLFESRWSLEQRVKRILEPGRTLMVRSQRGVGLLAMALLATAAVALAAIRPVADENATDGPGMLIRGQVVDEAGQPVAGARVNLAWDPYKPVEDVRSGADGAFALRIGSPDWSYRSLKATVDGRDLIGIVLNEGPPGQRAEPVRVVVKPSRPLRVRVTDSEGKAVARARVEVMSQGPCDRGETDAAGIVQFRLAADVGVEIVLALKDSVGFDYFENFRSWPPAQYGPPPPEISLTLDGARTVSVESIGSDGAPVPGVEFTPWTLRKPGKLAAANIGGSEIARARTDAAGLARFRWIPGELSEGCSLLFRPWDFQVPSPPQIVSGGDVTLTARVLRNARLNGRVTHPDGRPARGILLQAEGRGLSNHYGRVHARTDANGRYAMDVPPDQSYVIALIDPDWAAAPRSGLLLREGQTIGGLDFGLIQGTQVRGRITAGEQDTPAPGATVGFILQGAELPNGMRPSFEGERRESLNLWANTGPDGRYDLRLGPGEYVMRGPDHTPETIQVTGSGEIVRDFRKTNSSPWSSPEPEELSGFVSDPKGQPLAALVRVVAFRGRWQEVEALSDQAGRFTRGRREGVALYARNRSGTLAAMIPIAKQGVLKDIKLTLAPAARTSGHVVDEKGKPMSSLRVQLMLANGLGEQALHTNQEVTTTDTAGRFHFEGLIPGLPYEAWIADKEPSLNLKIRQITTDAPVLVDLGDIVVPFGAKP